MLLILTGTSRCIAQNLAPNCSFETYSTCPTSSSFDIGLALPWQSGGGGTSDYFNCSYLGSQPPNTGTGCAGISVYRPSWTDYREYITATLNTALLAGQSYDVQFYVIAKGCRATNAMGAYFSNGIPAFPPFVAVLNVVPQVANPLSNQLSSLTTYMTVSGTFIASGGENWITIGSFLSDANSTFTVIAGSCVVHYSYYFIDDVCVVPTGNPCICGSSALSVTTGSTNIMCNGQCTGTASVTPSNGASPYNYIWSNSQTTQTITGLCAGTYTVTVTDAVSSTATATVNITQPPAITSSVSVTGATCGNNNGSATITASGGTGALTYFWNPSGQTTATASGLGAGNYTATVTDANGCTQTIAATIVNTNGPVASVFSQTNPTCNGSSNGTASVTASGGSSPYTYNWSNGQSTSSVTGLSAGTYTVTVTDANGCTGTQTVLITQPSALTAITSSTNASTCTASDGSATVTPSGGTAPYTYLWNNAQITQTATGLLAGTYTVTVTDNNGCTLLQTVVVNCVTLTAVLGGPCTKMCLGDCQTMQVIAAGGASPYTYVWMPNIGAGPGPYSVCPTTSTMYTCMVYDALGDSAFAGGCLVSIWPTFTNVSVSATPASCGNNNGMATATASGATPPFNYVWSPSGGTNANATGLSAGTYTVTVTDASGCTQTQTVTITSVNTLSVTASSTQTGCTVNNGTATANPNNGTSPYSYNWNNGQTTQTATGLGSGNYSVTVTDANGCTQTQTVTVTSGNTLSVTASSTQTGCTVTNGTATANPSNGPSPYSYSWNNGQTTQTVTGLGSGNYSVTVTDANGCTQTQTVTVTSVSGPTATAGADLTITQGDSIMLNASGGATYSWSPSAGLNCITCANPVASPAQTTPYCVYVFDMNGCSDSSCVTVYVDFLCGAFYFPNAFSPNGDNENDVLKIYTGNINCVTEFHLFIYNRLGEKVFSAIGGPASGWEAMEWDGTYKGKTENTAVFVYYLDATLSNGEKIIKKGNISLMR